MFDAYQMDYSKGLMIVDCRDADSEEPDLKDKRCLKAILGNLTKELRVDGLVLNHFREKHYGRKTLKALRQVIVLATAMDQLAAQEPLPNFGNLSRKEVQARCNACQFNIAPLFANLKGLLLGDLPRVNFTAFKRELVVKATELVRHRYKGCRNCIKRTVDDLSYLLTEIERFAETVMAPNGRKAP